MSDVNMILPFIFFPVYFSLIINFTYKLAWAVTFVRGVYGNTAAFNGMITFVSRNNVKRHGNENQAK